VLRRSIRMVVPRPFFGPDRRRGRRVFFLERTLWLAALPVDPALFL